MFYLIAEHWRENVATDFVLCFSLHCGPISVHVKVVPVRVCFNRQVVEMLRFKEREFQSSKFCLLGVLRDRVRVLFTIFLTMSHPKDTIDGCCRGCSYVFVNKKRKRIENLRLRRLERVFS